MNQNSLLLFISARSPFVRRIRLALNRLGLEFQEQNVNVFDPTSEVHSSNPLGMIPTLMTPEIGAISDSSHILEYLHEKTGGIWPHDFKKRVEMRQASVWCTGIMQASVLYFQEKSMHEVPSPRWLSDHLSAIEDTLVVLSKLNSSLWQNEGKLSQAAWDLCVALQYIELRLPEIKWRERYPGFSERIHLAMENDFFRKTLPLA